ncbi:MAG: 23S rRNA (uracil(1939)-C(5))-methyltransferase RlmD, partial [Clostridiales bacterium]|nr:23S rRNA (uracil(1939)-C(5))-methyltransferase RlmD [Clostridiales bacterium]
MKKQSKKADEKIEKRVLKKVTKHLTVKNEKKKIVSKKQQMFEGNKEFVDRKKSDKNSVKESSKNQKNSSKTAKVGNKNPQSKNALAASECKIFKKCGACQHLDKSYEAQLKIKQKQVETLLKSHCKVNPIIGMENPYHYRNKVHSVFSRDQRGNIISGVYKEGTHHVVPVETCLIEDQKADEIIGTIRGLLKSFKIKTYDEDTGFGLLRYVLVKRGFTSNEIMVVLVIGSPVFPSKNNFVKALREKHPEITTVIVNVNNRSDSMILGNNETTIYGKGYIEDTLCGNVFRISSKSFYQVNPVQTEVLYQKAIDSAKLTGKETVIDAYCGIGTIGLVAAKHAKEVIGVELNKDAYKDAIANAKRNEINNVRFFNADASEFMIKLAQQKQNVDVVLMDPPRSGSTEVFIDAV